MTKSWEPPRSSMFCTRLRHLRSAPTFLPEGVAQCPEHRARVLATAHQWMRPLFPKEAPLSSQTPEELRILLVGPRGTFDRVAIRNPAVVRSFESRRKH